MMHLSCVYCEPASISFPKSFSHTDGVCVGGVCASRHEWWGNERDCQSAESRLQPHPRSVRNLRQKHSQRLPVSWRHSASPWQHGSLHTCLEVWSMCTNLITQTLFVLKRQRSHHSALHRALVLFHYCFTEGLWTLPRSAFPPGRSVRRSIK